MISDNLTGYLKKSILLLAAALPTVVYYFFIPFFWNGTDSLVYLTNDLSSAVPLYPPLYNGICETLMIITRQGPAAVYCLILLQHVVYVSGLLYLSGIFKSTRARLLFLVVMGLNVTIISAVNGVFPEGFFAGLELLFWGGFLRFILSHNNSWRAGFIWGICLVLLTLTKHIGQLWYSIPAGTAICFLIAGWVTKKNAYKKTALKTLGLSVASFIVLVIVQHSLLIYLKVKQTVVVGRQGIYRIKELPWNTLNPTDKEALLQHYTGWSNDPMLRTAFEAVAITHPWGETYNHVDSILKAQHIAGKTADDYLNEAFKAYLLHIEHYGITSTLNDLHSSLNMHGVANNIISNGAHELYPENHLPDNLKVRWGYLLNSENFISTNSFITSRVFDFFSGINLLFLLQASFVLFLACVLKFRNRLAALLLIPAIFAYAAMVVNCIITVFIIRYVLASYMEAYMVMALLLVAVCTPKRLLGRYFTIPTAL